MLKNISLKIAALFAFSVVSLSALAQTSYSNSNLTVTGAGVQEGVAFVQTSPVPTGSCIFNTIYIGQVTGNAGNAAAYATVLAAQSTGQQITVSYTNTSGTCTYTLVQTGP